MRNLVATAWADTEVEIKECLACDDRSRQSPRLCFKLVSQLHQPLGGFLLARRCGVELCKARVEVGGSHPQTLHLWRPIRIAHNLGLVLAQRCTTCVDLGDPLLDGSAICEGRSL